VPHSENRHFTQSPIVRAMFRDHNSVFAGPPVSGNLQNTILLTRMMISSGESIVTRRGDTGTAEAAARREMSSRAVLYASGMAKPRLLLVSYTLLPRSMT
jgi:hypothetical protein